MLAFGPVTGWHALKSVSLHNPRESFAFGRPHNVDVLGVLEDTYGQFRPNFLLGGAVKPDFADKAFNGSA